MSTDPSPLCCCEYQNIHGQRSHILAICCECDELDHAVDQCLKGNRVPREKVAAVFQVMSDRIRVPWFNGAKKVGLDIVMPWLFLPCSLHFACYGFVFTILSLVYVPIFIILYYAYVLNRRKKTWFFVSWGFTSLSGIFALFLLYVTDFASYLSTATISVGVGLVALFYLNVVFSKSRLKQHVISKPPQSEENGSCNGYAQESRDLPCCFCTEGPFIRAKHCRICGYCVPRSDHHCVWTNCCIGQHNHKSFLAAILLLIVTGLYGVCVSISTVCVPLGSSTLHLDCSNIYTDSRSTIVFVTTLYTTMFIFGMSCLFIQQFIFISFNITGDEWRRASKRKSLWEVYQTHCFNKGFIKNWFEFLCLHNVNITDGEMV